MMLRVSRLVLPLQAEKGGATRFFGSKSAGKSAWQLEQAPFSHVIIYNQSRHAAGSVLADLRQVWGTQMTITQVVEKGVQGLPGVDDVITIQPGKWGDMAHFETRLSVKTAQSTGLRRAIEKNQTVFMPGWSAFAESAETAESVDKLGLVWPGTAPQASRQLEKIGFKRICEQIGAPTPAFKVLSEEDQGIDLEDARQRKAFVDQVVQDVLAMKTSTPGLIKSIHGGGGRGTAHVLDPSSADSIEEAIDKVLGEMKRSDGIYFEERVNMSGSGDFFQLELEVDGSKVAHGGRFVWFNSALQKVIEVGLSDEGVAAFMPKELYEQARSWSSQIAQKAGNNTRATMEALVYKDADGTVHLDFIECNRRPQVENEALGFLEQDSSGNRRVTFAELVMRAAGYPAPALVPSGLGVALHARWLHGNPNQDGQISYQPGVVMGMDGPEYSFVVSELMAKGEISFTSDPQLGKAVLVAQDWSEMCDRACRYFETRGPIVQGSSSTYAASMAALFGSEAFRLQQVPSNQTFVKVEIPDSPGVSVSDVLRQQVTKVMVHGYRPAEGVSPDLYPTESQFDQVTQLREQLADERPRRTAFTNFVDGVSSYSQYMDDLQDTLENQGGGMVTVAPRDTRQQAGDSESAAITDISRQNVDVYGERAGFVGYEIGGAQYQAALIRGFDPSVVLRLGLPFSMPGFSLQRSQYVNGLTELSPVVRQPLFESTVALVQDQYQTNEVPWFPYNFHAGNFFDPETGHSPQDITTAEMLDSGIRPMPTWVTSPHFSLTELSQWTARQIDLFGELRQVRIKNPGQGRSWTAENIWKEVDTILSVFRDRGLPLPITYIHNHDFDGRGGHEAQALLKLAQSNGYSFLVVDTAYRKSGTHNDNTVVADALVLTSEQREALLAYNHYQQAIEKMTLRFDSTDSQMTPWNSDWAGGTEGSDLRIAKEFGLAPSQINQAKDLASEVFPLERAVTPFSEYKLRLGIAIMTNTSINPKTPEAVRDYIQQGGTLQVGGDVLVGLRRWETLVKKPPVVDQLLENHRDDLAEALKKNATLISELPSGYTHAQRFNELGFQEKGREFNRRSQKGEDLTSLLLAPELLHRRPMSHPAGMAFSIWHQGQSKEIIFDGFGTASNGDITLSFQHQGVQEVVQTPDPNAQVQAMDVQGLVKADPNNTFHFPAPTPGELKIYHVAIGDRLEEGDKLCTIEQMKMEIVLRVPEKWHGLQVKSLSCKARDEHTQGDMLVEQDLILEVEAPLLD